MADTKTQREGAAHKEIAAKNTQSLARTEREGRGLRRWDPAAASPFEFMERMSEEMDRWFDRVSRDIGFPRRSWFSRGLFGTAASPGAWTPRVEAFQKGDRFIVRAELPGLKKDDVQVELAENALTIRGERREEHEEEQEGFYHSEREYGQFYRTVPLPEGVIGDSAQATFKDGVLEVSMPAPPAEASRGRRLEIQEASGGRKTS